MSDGTGGCPVVAGTSGADAGEAATGVDGIDGIDCRGPGTGGELCRVRTPAPDGGAGSTTTAAPSGAIAP
jgi:hypothetical protein